MYGMACVFFSKYSTAGLDWMVGPFFFVIIYYRMIPTCDYVSEDKGHAPVSTVAYTASGLCLYIMFDLLCLFQQK